MSKPKNKARRCKDCGFEIDANLRYCHRCYAKRMRRLGKRQAYAIENQTMGGSK